jgi:1,4-alpha-glucan branching enzyme
MMNRIKAPQLQGYLALVLHAHIPYFRPSESQAVQEELWYYQAMTDTYLPLLAMIKRLQKERIDFRLTLSLTPTLLALFSDPAMIQRYDQYLTKNIHFAAKEQQRIKQDAALHAIAKLLTAKLQENQAVFESCSGNLVHAFKQLQDEGFIEIIASTATHAFLPLMKTEEAMKAQIATAIRDYKRHFARKPRGIWLPECGFTPGIDRILQQFGIDYFFVDSAAVAMAVPQPSTGLAAPLKTPYGVHAFPIDPDCINQVSHTETGYHGDYDYREVPRESNEVNYYRITGPGNHRELYKPRRAMMKAAKHADHFLSSRQQQIKLWSLGKQHKPIIVAAYNAELFGHWWNEGIQWLELLNQKICQDQSVISLITPSEYLNEFPSSEIGLLRESSWGRSQSFELWLHDHNAWIYRHLHQAEERMIKLATVHEHQQSSGSSYAGLLQRALNQASRKLMLAQCSDWAMLLEAGVNIDLAVQRTKSHIGCFHYICDMIERLEIDERLLCDLEEKDKIFPLTDYLDFASIKRTSPIAIIEQNSVWRQLLQATMDQPNVFMLSWEYPPKNVGGLSRSVHELSEALAAEGEIIHVITTAHEDAPSFEIINGVYIHRLTVLCSGDTSFYDWVFEMNIAMIDHLISLKENGARIDLLHAHDWMVMHTAREIKLSYNIPLIATIHATEWGRNQGVLHTELQHNIHRTEWQLTYEAARVFVCSHYMKQQVQHIFQLPEDKVHVYPNGITLKPGSSLPQDLPAARPPFLKQTDKVIFCIGRLVYEKGIQVLLDAMPLVLAHAPEAKLVIGGSGPMEQELRALASHLGDRVWFTGFVDTELRELLYQTADLCVIPSLYEPFGIVALEVIAARKPLVLSDTGGLSEIIQHGIGGFKALPGNRESFAWHITELLHKPELGQRMASTAYLSLHQTYEWSHIAQDMQKQYRSLIQPQEVLVSN